MREKTVVRFYRENFYEIVQTYYIMHTTIVYNPCSTNVPLGKLVENGLIHVVFVIRRVFCLRGIIKLNVANIYIK